MLLARGVGVSDSASLHGHVLAVSGGHSAALTRLEPCVLAWES